MIKEERFDGATVDEDDDNDEGAGKDDGGGDADGDAEGDGATGLTRTPVMNDARCWVSEAATGGGGGGEPGGECESVTDDRLEDGDSDGDGGTSTCETMDWRDGGGRVGLFIAATAAGGGGGGGSVRFSGAMKPSTFPFVMTAIGICSADSITDGVW